MCLLLVRSVDMRRANAAMLAATAPSAKPRYTWLTPPPSLGDMTVADVRKAKNAVEHMQLVRAWAAAAWSAWSPHHETIYTWLPKDF